VAQSAFESCLDASYDGLSTLLKRLCQFIQGLIALLEYLLCFFLGQKKEPPCPDHACPPALRKPDPFIYCQYYLMSLGYPVTWDNPDIFIFDGTTLVDPHALQASTAYTVVARIWNNSTNVPVVNLNVAFSYLSFGMGTQSHLIGASTTDLGVKGLPGCPAFAYITWTTPAALGHYCLQVLLEPPDDLNWANNLGQRNTDVTQPASPAIFTFAVGNHDGPQSSTVAFTVDTYSIPPLSSCSEDETDAARLRSISKIATPVPDDWTVVITPNELQLAAGQEMTVQAAITPPPGFSGTMPFNITAQNDMRAIGGVTLYAEVP
jgi:hypothetical protein